MQFPELLAGSRDKETLTFCQIYAVGYKQRHPDWANDPWLHCWGLMDQQFGQTHVSLREAINRNPAAVLDHVRWNAILLPTALQVGLFGATSGSLNPKYLPISTENSILLLPTIVVSLTILLGLFYLYKDWAYWWANGLKQRVWGWLTLLAITGANLVTAIVIHPNPEYLYGLTLFLMSLFGLSLWVISRRWFSSKRLSAAMPLVMVLSLFFLPNYYSNPKHIRPRQLHDIYQRLAPFMQIVNKGETVLLGSEAGQVCNYFGYGQCQGIEYHTLLSHLSEQSPLNFLDEEGVNLIYMDETLKSILLQLNPSAAKQFFNQPADFGWKLVAGQEENNSQWMIFARQ